MAKTLKPDEELLETPEATAPVDDKPQVIKADLRKFNKAEAAVNKQVAALLAIVKVETKEEADQALETLKAAKTVETMIESKRKDLKAPFFEAGTKIDAYAKKLVQALPAAINGVKFLVLEYNRAEEKKKLDARSETRRLQLLSLGFTRAEGETVYKNGELSVSDAEVAGYELEAWTSRLADLVVKIQAAKDAEVKKLSENREFFGTSDAETDKKIEELQKPPAPVHVPSFGGGGARGGSSGGSVKGVTKTWTFEVQEASLVPREFLTVDEIKIRQAIAAGNRSIAGVRIYQKEGLSVR